MARMLVCRTHKTVDTLPDYNTAEDMEGKYDYELQDAIRRHLDKYGSDPNRHASLMLRVEDDELALLDPERMKQAIFDDTLEAYLRGERDQLKSDALACYNLHNRPVVGKPGCQDYRADHRVIGRKTGIPRSQRSYLCDFCPYQSYVEHEKNKKRRFAGE
jgi:hypothetical protein